MKNLSTLEIVDSIQFIEDGINAARIVAQGSDGIVSEDARDEALAWVFDRLMESTVDLRAELMRKLAEERIAAQI